MNLSPGSRVRNSSYQKAYDHENRQIVALIGLLAMASILIYGYTIENFSSEGAKLLAMPWGEWLVGRSVCRLRSILMLDCLP